MNKDTYNFEYWPEKDTNMPIRLSFDVNDLHCAQFHKMCKIFAVALGFQPNTVEEYFGPDSDDWLE